MELSKLKYTEYIQSAKRHSESCKVILERINNYEETDTVSNEVKNLTLNLFYLSGYIIECTLKYHALLTFGHDEILDVGQDSCESIGINYKKKIKTHKFTTISELIESKISGFSYLHENDSDLNNLIESWDPEYRYINSSIEFERVKKFYTHANSILRKA